MKVCVTDASVFGPLIFEDEKGTLIADLPGLIEQGACIVPQHWRLEVTNQILSGLRRKRLTEALADAAIAQVDMLPIAIDDETGRRYAASYALAVRHDLTLYDAAYLELAIRRGSPLASHDAQLRRAALNEKIELIPA